MVGQERGGHHSSMATRQTRGDDRRGRASGFQRSRFGVCGAVLSSQPRYLAAQRDSGCWRTDRQCSGCVPLNVDVLQGIFVTRSQPTSVCPSRQSGVSLIEVLVSVLLLTFGIVGMAGLQFNGTKFNHGAYLRSQGTSLAYDVADRMRANLAESYLTGFVDVFDAGVGPACGAALGAATALRDVNQWKSCVETVLPQGSGRVSRLATGAVYVDQCGVNHIGIPGRAMFVVEVTWNNGRLQNENNLDCVVVRTEVSPQ